jgi:hypothetical protein
MYKGAVILLVLCIGTALSENDVIVKNLKIYSNCEEFFIKAFCYAPSPRGLSNVAANVSLRIFILLLNRYRVKEDFVDGESIIWE